MSDDVTGEMELPEDPIDDAWFQSDLATVERLARARLGTDENDASAHTWLGLALFRGNTVAAGRASLTKAAELLRAAQAKTSDEELKAELGWALQALADRLLEAVEPPLLLAAAQFVVDGLKLEHPPSLRQLVEDVAEREGNPVKAATMLKRALAADPTDAESHYLAARIFARVGRRPNSMGHLKKAVEHAQGALAVRSLARFESDFDGFRDDEEFKALVDVLPRDAELRPLYLALEEGDAATVLVLARSLPESLDVLHPLRDALELLVEDDAESWAVELERVQALIDAREDAEEASPAYARFRGES